MNSHCLQRLTFTAIATILGIVASTSFAQLIPASAQTSEVTPVNTSFPDTENYWAQPFIQALAERNIVTGYPDNTFRPEQPVARDEFAAILRQAFSQAPERQLRTGSVYKDIPEGYWAASAIEEAYEMGFMRGYPGGEFRPNQPVTKVEVLTSLARNIELPETTAATAKPVAVAPTPAPVATAPTTTSQQPATRQQARRPLMFPLAMTALMQPFVTTSVRAPAAPNPSTANNNTAPAPESTSASTNASETQRPVSLAVSDYYQDADQIPQYAVDAVAQTTAAGIVVNYPDRQILNPNQPASRGEVSALIQQTLVHQGRITPLAADETARTNIVNR